MRWVLVVLLLLPGGPIAAQEPGPGSGAVDTVVQGADLQVLVPSSGPLAGRVRVFHSEDATGRAERAVRVLEGSADLPGLPTGVPSGVDLFLASDRQAFDRMTGGEVPHWGAGVAIPSLDRIVIPLFAHPWTGGGSEDRTLLHEWAHLGLHQRLEGWRVPRWLDEGYAQWASGGWDASAGWQLRVALARGSAPPLDSLRLAWPRGESRARLAYLLSASAVEYLIDQVGERGLEVLLDRWAETGEFETSFRRTFGMTTGTFEQRWARHVSDRYGWIVILSHSAVFWGALAVALLVMVRIRRTRDRERMAELRADEPPDRPAYWAPPPHPPIGGFQGENPEPGVGRPVSRGAGGDPDTDGTLDPSPPTR